MVRIIGITLALFFSAIAGLGPSLAQTKPAQPALSFEQLVARIQEGDQGAMETAGDSGDPKYIPYLRAVLVKEKYSMPIALFALAALGDQESLQVVTCAARSENPMVTVGTIPALRRVRGWFSIRLLEKLLTEPLPDKVWEARLRKYVPDNPKAFDIYTPPSPSDMALMTFRHVLPGLPDSVPSDDGLVVEQAAKWRPFFVEWIRTHEAELRKLKPTGEGIDLSEKACNTRKIRKLAKRIERAYLAP